MQRHYNTTASELVAKSSLGLDGERYVICVGCNKPHPIPAFLTKTGRATKMCVRCRTYPGIVNRTEKTTTNVRNKMLHRKYGLSAGEYEAMAVRQGGLCAICGRPETARSCKGRTKTLAVDHDHSTGVVRGLLCTKCNGAIGLIENTDIDFSQWTTKAHSYLKRTVVR